jgi:hypothetical protein
MTSYRVTEYDEDTRGHPAFELAPDVPSPLAPVLIIVIRPGGSTDVYRQDGTPWPAGHLTPGDVRVVAARKHRELTASGFYDLPDIRNKQAR